MSKVLLSRSELEDIWKIAKDFPDAKTFTISSKSISGIGVITKVKFSQKIDEYFVDTSITITDENDW